MNLSISNLSWKNKELDKVIKILKLNKIKYIEYSLYNLTNNDKSRKKIFRIKKYWKKRYFNLYSMQSVLYKVKN